FTPEQAEIALQLKPMPEPVAVIAERLGMDESEAAEKLESMAKEGLIYRVRIGDEPHYLSMQFIIGIYEFHLNSIDREFAELMEEYFPHLGKTWASVKTKQLRVVPVGSAVDTAPAVATYDRIRDLVKSQEIISVASCICRKEQGLMENECKRPHEVCIQFGFAAQYYIENGMARQIGVDEAMKLLDLAEESALVLSPTNTQEIMGMCCCCECCCGMLRILKMFPRPADQVQSSFQSKINPDLCNACGTCLERCQIEAIKEGEEVMEVDLARCIGCGLCVPSCPEEAITLIEKPEVAAPPADMMEMMIRLAEERGVS
ncbi:MAG: 4Fe-4S binding protein, partial [Deltaproteobacteria bacterium]